MGEFFKNYKEKPNKEILDIMHVLNEEFDKTKTLIADLTTHLVDVEKKFNLLYNEIKKRKG